jgi:hypothetical protein
VQGAQVVLNDSTRAYNANSNDTITISGTKSTFTGKWLVIGGDNNVFIDGQGDTIVWNTSDSDGVNKDNPFTGMNINNSYDVTCSGLVIIQSGGEWGSAITHAGAKHIRFVDCNVHMYGANSGAIRAPSGGSGNFMWEIDGGNWTSFVDSFDSRCNFDAVIMAFRCQNDCIDSSVLEGYYTALIHNITIDSCPHAGIQGAGRMIVDSNTFWINAHNDQYTRPSGNVCFSADNAYAITATRVYRGTTVGWNTIRRRDSYEGGRGILIEGANGTSADPVVIRDNNIIASQGLSDAEDVARGGCWGIRVRQDMDTWDPCRHVHIHDNTVTVYSDSSDSDTHIGEDALGLFFSDADEGNVDSLGESCFVYNNVVTAYADSTNYGDLYGKTIAFGTEVLGSGRGHKSYNNHFSSNATIAQFGEYNGGGDGWLSVADTFEWIGSAHYIHISTQTGDTAAIALGNNGGAEACTANFIQDPIFIPSTLPEDEIRNVRTDGDKDVTLQVTLTLTVKDNSRARVENATCSVWTGNDTTLVTSGTTDVNGQLIDTIDYIFRSWAKEEPTHTDYNGVNGFVFKAIYSGDSVVVDSIVGWDSKQFTFTLAGIGEYLLRGIKR